LQRSQTTSSSPIGSRLRAGSSGKTDVENGKSLALPSIGEAVPRGTGEKLWVSYKKGFFGREGKPNQPGSLKGEELEVTGGVSLDDSAAAESLKTSFLS